MSACYVYFLMSNEFGSFYNLKCIIYWSVASLFCVYMVVGRSGTCFRVWGGGGGEGRVGERGHYRTNPIDQTTVWCVVPVHPMSMNYLKAPLSTLSRNDIYFCYKRGLRSVMLHTALLESLINSPLNINIRCFTLRLPINMWDKMFVELCNKHWSGSITVSQRVSSFRRVYATREMGDGGERESGFKCCVAYLSVEERACITDLALNRWIIWAVE